MKQKDRGELGQSITGSLAEHRDEIDIADKVVTQSSDSEYHCLTVRIFYNRVST